jgi:outer membrane receptor protein involved in Fe transport
MRAARLLDLRVLVLSLAVAAVAMASGQRAAHAQASTGAVQGRVLEKGTGKPMEGVTVVATSPALQGTQAEITDETGFYLIQNLPPGIYEIAFYYGNAQVHQPNVRVQIGGTTPINLKLDPDAVQGESITIIQQAPAIDSGSTKQGLKMDKDYVKNVPLAGRTYEGAIGSAAGAQDDGVGVSFSGSTSVENNYVVDGINTTGLTFGTISAPLLSNFVEEIEVITGGYDAEFGRSTGGVVNVVTKSGSNEFHGSTWVNFTSGVLQLTPKGAHEEGSSISAKEDSTYDTDFGFELGGPIVKDRIWFYVGFAPILTGSKVTRIVSTQVDRDNDGNPDVDPATGFPVFEPIDESKFNVAQATYQFTGKLNFAVSPDHQGSVALTGSSFDNHNLNSVDGTAIGTQSKSKGLTTDGVGRWTSKFNNNKTELEGTLGWHRSSNDTTPIASALPNTPGALVRNTPAVVQFETDLPSVGHNIDSNESDKAMAACTDLDPTDPLTMNDPFPKITNCPLASYQYGSPGPLENIVENRYSAKVSVTQRFLLVGHHQFKVGFDGEDNFLKDDRSFSGGVALSGYQDRWEQLRYIRLGSGSSTCYDADGNPGPCDYLDTLGVHGNSQNWAAFVQDKWDVLPNLRLNVGVRYEQQTLKNADEVRGMIDPVTGQTYGEDALNLKQLWAPRIGFSYDWTKEGRSKVYASYGRFYESIPMDLNQIAFGGETDYIAKYTNQQCGGAEGTDPTTGEPVYQRTNTPTGCPTSAVAPGGGADTLGGGSTLVEPGLSAQRLDEVVVGAEYEPFADITLGLFYQNRSLARVIEDVSVDGTQSYILANPGEFSADAERDLENTIANMAPGDERDIFQQRLENFRKVRQFDKPSRNYNAFTFTAKKRFSHNFFAQGSYTYSRLQGNYPGLYSDNNNQLLPNISSQYDLFELLANRQGRLPADRPHNVKLSGYYRLDLKEAGGVTMGVNFSAFSGKPIELLGSHAYYGQTEVFVLPRGAGGRTDFVTQADLRAGWDKQLGGGMTLSVYLDLLNVYNSQTETAVDQNYTIDNVNPIVGGSIDDLKYLKQQDADGNETGTPAAKVVNWRNATAYQEPLTARIGVNLTF